MDNNKNKNENSNSENPLPIEHNKKYQIALWLYDILTDKLKADDGFEIQHHLKWGPTSDPVTFDIVVRKNRYITSVFEVQEKSSTAKAAGIIMPYYVFKNTTAVLCIVYCCRTETFHIYTREMIETDDTNMVVYDGEELINVRYKSRSTKNLDSVIKDIKSANAHTRAEIVEDLDVNDPNSKSLKLKFHEEKVLDPEWSRTQFGEYVDLVCRYSTLDSLFSTLKFGTFRMNGLPGMNDKSEGLFAWNMIYDSHKFPAKINELRNDTINNVFIISYSNNQKIEDLTQWRLYGDDAKGVCCIYSVIKEKVKDRFFLHPINYIDPKKRGKSRAESLLAQLKSFVTTQSDLDSSDLSTVIFFYKHKEYEPEGEVRLLVDNKKTSAYATFPYKREWLLTNSNNIPNPYIDIPLKEFPLKLERIILGPNINDAETIQVQLETILKQLGINAVVEKSTITSYRNPIKK